MKKDIWILTYSCGDDCTYSCNDILIDAWNNYPTNDELEESLLNNESFIEHMKTDYFTQGEKELSFLELLIEGRTDIDYWGGHLSFEIKHL